jgi:hypothetical protein
MRPWNQFSSMPLIDALEDRAVAELVEVGEDLLGLALHLVGQFLDEVRAAERVGDVGDVGLVGDDLLGAQRDPRRLLGRQGECLVHRVGVQRLGAAEHAGERLDRVRTMLTSGCWAVSDTPAVWVWNRSCIDVRAGRRSAPSSTAPRCGGRRAAWRSPRRSRCGR